MKTNAGVLKSLSVLLLAALFTACTSEAHTAVVIPTLAVLSSATPTPSLTPSPTIPPTIPSTATTVCDVAGWWKDAQDLVVQFLDTADVAAHTARVGLGTIVLQLRQVERAFQKIDSPDCVSDISTELVVSMDSVVYGFTGFMGQSDSASQAGLQIGTQHFWNADQLLKARSIFADHRLGDTAVWIWGGDSPNAMTATWLITFLTPTQAAFVVTLEPTEPPVSKATNTSGVNGLQLPNLEEINATATALSMQPG